MITYPVNIETDRFTFKLSGDVRRTQRWPRADGQRIANAAPGLIILQESRAAVPSFNPLTQKLSEGAWVDDEPNQTAIWTRTVLALSSEELATVADSADREAKRTLVANAIPTLRQWAIDARAVTVTSGNAVQTLQVVVTRLATFFDRFADLLQAQRLDQ